MYSTNSKQIYSNKAKEHLETCFKLYTEYKWLLDSYIVDFFTNNYWDKLITSWRNFFESHEPKKIIEILHYEQKSTKLLLPLSLLAAKEVLYHVTLLRKPNTKKSLVGTSYKNVFSHVAVNNLFWKHVKQKKMYEISLLGKRCAEIVNKIDVDLIVDCGSGLGHLARLLTYKYKLPVVCLEAQDNLTKRAIELDKEFERRATKYDESLLQNCLPIHLNYILETNVSAEDFLRTVTNGNDLLKIGLIGLHPCGDLAPTLLRLFKTSNRIRFISTVGCCYMKLTEIGHPLNESLKNKSVSYAARELACHAVEQLVQQANKEGVDSLRIHAWRAALEEIMLRHWPHMKHAGLNSVKYSKDITFQDYCSQALRGKQLFVAESDINCEYTKYMLDQVDKVVIFNYLRTFFAPLIETILLLDRLLYVSDDEDITTILEPIFDPLISARNHLFIAYK